RADRRLQVAVEPADLALLVDDERAARGERAAGGRDVDAVLLRDGEVDVGEEPELDAEGRREPRVALDGVDADREDDDVAGRELVVLLDEALHLVRAARGEVLGVEG